MMNSKDTSIDIKSIRDSYRLLNTKDKHIQWLSERRMRHCLSCTLFTDARNCNSKMKGPHIKTGQITSGCGCHMPAKTKLEKAVCPLGKW